VYVNVFIMMTNELNACKTNDDSAYFHFSI